MDGSHPIRIARDGDHQVVHLPPGLEAPAGAVVRQDGERLVIEAAPPKIAGEDFAALLATWEPIEDRLEPIEDLPLRPVRL